MKQLKYLLMAAFVGMAFVACSDDDVVDDTGKGTIVGDETWMSISVQPVGAKTRALHSGEEETGKANESTINSLKVILFDGFDDAAKVTNVVDINSVTAGTAVSAFKVSSSAEAVLTIVNPTSQMPAVILGDTYAKVNSVLTATVEQVIGTGSTPSNFMMTNASGKLEPQIPPTSATTGNEPYVDATAGYLKDNCFGETASAAEDKALTIKVDRVVAKVRVYNNYAGPANSSPTTADEIEFVMTDFGWALNVTNRKFFPVSQRIHTQLELNKINSTSPASTDWTPYDTWRFGSYRIDPNYNTLSGSASDNLQPTIATTAESATNADYRAAYRFYDEDGQDSDLNSVSWNSSSSAGVDQGDPEEGATNPKTNVEYCLENTQDEAGNYQAYTTHALIKANVYPSHFMDTDGSLDQAPVAGTAFLKIGTAYYTYETLLNNIEVEVTNYINHSTALSIAVVFNAYLIYANIGAVDIDAVIAGEAGDTAAKATAVKDAFDSKETNVTTYGAATDGTVSYYAGGISYYKVMIKHDNNDGTSFINKLGEFGVVRNSVYDITINGVNAPGYAVIPQPNPGDEDEELESWLSVSIDINPWTWYTQSVVLE